MVRGGLVEVGLEAVSGGQVVDVEAVAGVLEPRQPSWLRFRTESRLDRS